MQEYAYTHSPLLGEGPLLGYTASTLLRHRTSYARSNGTCTTGPYPLYLKTLRWLSTFILGAREAVRKCRESGDHA